jgi:hypothetical protein
VAAHGAVALIVDEQHGEIGFRMIGLNRDDAVHVKMAARLENEKSAQLIQMLAGIPALIQNPLSGDLRKAAHDQPYRLARGMHFDRINSQIKHG